MNSVEPPKSDDTIERHQFYTKASSRIELNTKDINGIGKKISSIGHEFDIVKTNVNTFSAKLKVMGAIASVLFSIIQAIGGWYLDKAATTVDKALSRIEVLEKKMNTIENDVNGIKTTPTEIARLKQLNGSLQSQIDEINVKLEVKK